MMCCTIHKNFTDRDDLVGASALTGYDEELCKTGSSQHLRHTALLLTAAAFNSDMTHQCCLPVVSVLAAMLADGSAINS